MAERLVRLVTCQNPEIDNAQAIRLLVWDEPRVIGCAKNFAKHSGVQRSYRAMGYQIPLATVADGL